MADTMMSEAAAVLSHSSRRGFLKSAAATATGLTIGFHWLDPLRRALADTPKDFVPNAFLRIAPDNSVTVVAKHLEMGQGSYTGLATVVADELDADWGQIRVESAPADASKYANLRFGTIQGTGGSSAMANSWMQLRKAGATARAMLVAAAAAEWNVAPASLVVERGVVSHAPSQHRATFGELASKASDQPVPTDVPLKDPKDFKLIGQKLPRVDLPGKTNGNAQFTIDVTLPGMLVALLQRPPWFGGTVKSFDATATKRVPGVVEVVQVPRGVAVVGNGFWAAKQGRDALKVEWDDSKAEKRGTAAIFAEYRKLAEQPGLSARSDGDVAAAFKGAAKTLTASSSFPIWRTRRWSRSTPSSSSTTTLARSGPAISSRPSIRPMRRRPQASSLSRSRSTPCWLAAALAGGPTWPPTTSSRRYRLPRRSAPPAFRSSCNGPAKMTSRADAIGRSMSTGWKRRWTMMAAWSVGGIASSANR
jgi:CO/xanthine dehydrogenase Mo-binding subunit